MSSSRSLTLNYNNIVLRQNQLDCWLSGFFSSMQKKTKNTVLDQTCSFIFIIIHFEFQEGIVNVLNLLLENTVSLYEAVGNV